MAHVRTRDGRRIDIEDVGDRDAPAVVFHSGTPMGIRPLPLIQDPARDRGLRLIRASRPGYGDSTPNPGRAVVDVVADTEDVLTALDVAESWHLGYSGGGPHALACGARLDGARAVAVLAGAMPFTTVEDFTAGMGEDNVTGFTAAATGEAELRELLEEDPDRMQSVTPEQMLANMESLLPPVDREHLTGSLAADMLASMQEAYRVGVEGSMEDNLAFVRHWGFELDEITIPVSIWQGTEDLMVPLAHGRRLAELMPNASTHILEGEGHVSMLVRRMGAILDELVAT